MRTVTIWRGSGWYGCCQVGNQDEAYIEEIKVAKPGICRPEAEQQARILGYSGCVHYMKKPPILKQDQD